jgi:hypothetical protein
MEGKCEAGRVEKGEQRGEGEGERERELGESTFGCGTISTLLDFKKYIFLFFFFFFFWLLYRC